MPPLEQSINIKTLLKQSRDLCVLSDEQLDRLAQEAQELRVQRGDYVWRLNEPVKYIYLLAEGFLHVQMLGVEGDFVITGFVAPHSIIGEAEAFIEEGQYLNHIIAVEPSYLLALPKESFINVVKDNVDFAFHWLRIANKKFLATLQQVHGLKIGTPRARLARMLLTINRRRLWEGVQQELPLSQQAIGLYAGLSRQVVSVILSDWKRKGIVSIGYGRVKLENLEALTQIAEES